MRDNNSHAIAAILIAVLALSFGDAVIKLISGTVTLWQIYVIRSLIALPILLVLMRATGDSASLLPLSLFWVSLRSVLLGLMWISYYVALPHIKLSVAAAVYYTTPLFIALLSTLLIGDRPARSLWIAIAMGFGGVLIIVRPETEGFNRYGLLPLLAAVLYAFAMIVTRTRCQRESPKVLSFALNITFAVIGLSATLLLEFGDLAPSRVDANPFLLGGWQWPGASQWLAFFVLALVIVIGSWLAAVAYQKGTPSVVAIFDYAYLIFSAVWGGLLFAEKPDAVTLSGMALIAIAGYFAVRSGKRSSSSGDHATG